jgi:uncharacterized oligopeptide transporter (OPT) family protein
MLVKKPKDAKPVTSPEAATAGAQTKAETGSTQLDLPETRTAKDVSKAIKYGFIAYIICAIVLAVLTGLYAHMSAGMLIGWVLFAALVAFAHELIVGLSAMHAGWFPAFAVALISLVLGMIIGFPSIPLAILVAFAASTGPAFADMGYDFKTGWILRSSNDRAYELEGRKQQYWASLMGFAAAFIVVAIAHGSYFANGLFPPVDKVFVATIEAGLTGGHIGMNLLLWAIPGAIVQLIGGPSRQIGIMFATGLLITNPIAGWAVLVGILIRLFVLKKFGKGAESTMSIMAAGFIAGDALYGFGNSLYKVTK